MIRVKALNVNELRKAAANYSASHPELYVIGFTLFNEAYVSGLKRIAAHTPTDTNLGGYWLAGEFKPFTKAQLERNQRLADTKD